MHSALIRPSSLSDFHENRYSWPQNGRIRAKSRQPTTIRLWISHFTKLKLVKSDRLLEPSFLVARCESVEQDDDVTLDLLRLQERPLLEGGAHPSGQAFEETAPVEIDGVAQPLDGRLLCQRGRVVPSQLRQN